MQLLIGTNNEHKLGEIKAIFQARGLSGSKIFSVKDLIANAPDIEETGSTLEENAMLKAKTFFELEKIPTIADDTGLEIDALQKQPGVLSARFSGVHGDDASNRKKVLSLLKNVPMSARTACFRTVICFTDDSNTQLIEGVCCGKIIEEERGTNGFGYDSIFVPDGYEQTFAEMKSEEKNKISHRMIAINKLCDFLLNY